MGMSIHERKKHGTAAAGTPRPCFVQGGVLPAATRAIPVSPELPCLQAVPWTALAGTVHHLACVMLLHSCHSFILFTSQPGGS